METTYEIEIWQDTQKMKQIKSFIAAITILAWVCCLIGQIGWNDNVTTTTTLLGKTKHIGWPVKFFYYGLFVGLAGLISFIIVLLSTNNKYPVLALNNDGLFINQQLISQTMVEWTNISNIKLTKEEKDNAIEIYFIDANKVIEKQSNAKKSFLKENLKDGKPLVCSDKFTQGDLVLLNEKAKRYTLNT